MFAVIVVGICQVCGREVRRVTGYPEQWLIDRPIWTQCGNEVHGVLFTKKEDKQ